MKAKSISILEKDSMTIPGPYPKRLVKSNKHSFPKETDSHKDPHTIQRHHLNQDDLAILFLTLEKVP
jgi:hypothetical protein